MSLVCCTKPNNIDDTRHSRQDTRTRIEPRHASLISRWTRPRRAPAACGHGWTLITTLGARQGPSRHRRCAGGDASAPRPPHLEAAAAPLQHFLLYLFAPCTHTGVSTDAADGFLGFAVRRREFVLSESLYSGLLSSTLKTFYFCWTHRDFHDRKTPGNASRN
ncbi:hypothetical protein EVAR_30126_1 [Eumeta japonica]|uniref:Uncharacterized protein n=1 Tax=Eumeta variegata TaxID=151549 RepID=A0A4C1WGA2_EUMVA|nr:hypothetical protein EVAR_30126_1 [Eumeta japonica]